MLHTPLLLAFCCFLLIRIWLLLLQVQHYYMNMAMDKSRSKVGLLLWINLLILVFHLTIWLIPCSRNLYELAVHPHDE